ncbi:hypothetical protein PG623_09450 [Riemerella anatipestifer]|nr:hypothetical protein [Riemerella anatipestifer]MDY3521083.1 hypothetical protein [Riemerella anatipestifer]MDY3533157.1 hypothetical protein [Riemerella anatipestifer]
MKKQIFILGALSINILSYAQIKTNKTVSQDVIPNQTAFLDASSTPQWNTSTNIGKGLVFPRTDLTQLNTLIATPNGVSLAYPNRLDGMIVYNTATGKSAIGNVDVTSGFYYYENKSNTLSGGIWKPLGGTSPVTANIYTTDGTLAGNRTVDMNGKNLQFTGNGNFGIGTDTPETKLDIEGTVKIVDGTQGAGKVLTSDSNGNASWETPTMSYAYTIGMGDKNNTYPATDLAAVNDKYKYTGMKITLPTKGKYAVLLDLNISLAPSLSVSPQLPHNPVYNPNINRLSSGESIIIRGAFWDEILSEGIDKNTDNVPIKNKANSMWRGEVIYPLYMRRASNTMYIENTTSGPKTFYFYAMASIENPSPSAPIRYIYELGSGRWAEESLLAFKIGE